MGTISLCVIARDEEDMLPGLLESVRGIVDEVILVDTGSQDATVALAEADGARVIHHPWQDDFSEARNVAADAASSVYVLVLDADERLAPGAGQVLRRVVEDNQVNCGLLPLHNAATLEASLESVVKGDERKGEPVLLPRLFRRTNDLRWEGAIHEVVPPSVLQHMGPLSRIDVPIVHYGAVPEVREAKEKDKRNLRLLEKRCQEEPLNPHIHAFLAREYLRIDDMGRAAEVVEKAWKTVPAVIEGQSMTPQIVSLAAIRSHLMLHHGRYAEALATMVQAREWGAAHPNVDIMSGAACEMLGLESDGEEREGFLTDAVNHYRACLLQDGKTFLEEVAPGATSWAAATRLGTTYLLLGQPTLALEQFSRALEVNPGHLEAGLGRCEALYLTGDPATALAEAEPFLPEDWADGWVIAASACELLGRPEETEVISQRAAQLAENGFIAAHRRGTLEQLRLACQIYKGEPEAGPGPMGILGALLSRTPLEGNLVAGQPANGAVVGRVILNLVVSQRMDMLDDLLTPRAEELMPGIRETVIGVLGQLDVPVEDDGQSQFVFIGGAGRSGTTLFRAMLDAHQDIHCGPESKLVPAICMLRNEWWKTHQGDLKAAGVNEEILDAAVGGFVSALLNGLGQDKECVADKTPHNLLYMEQLSRSFPRARFIHLIRDGRAVAASLVRQDWKDLATGESVHYCKDLASAASYWSDMILRVRSQIGCVPGRYLEVHYEDLVSDPEAVMKKVLAFLGQAWDPSVLSHEKNADLHLSQLESSSEDVAVAIHQDAVDKWRQELNEVQLEELTQIAGETLKWLGYQD